MGVCLLVWVLMGVNVMFFGFGFWSKMRFLFVKNVHQ